MSGRAGGWDEDALLAGTVGDAWARCLPLWRRRGRVQDLLPGHFVTRYTPSPERLLGSSFAERYREDYPFLVAKLESDDLVEVKCAFDLLREMFDCIHEDDPELIQAIPVPVPGWVREEMACLRSYQAFQGATIGEWFHFIREEDR